MNRTISSVKQGRQITLDIFLDFLKRQWYVLALASLLLIGFAVVRTYSASFISDIVERLQARAPLAEVMGLAFLGAALACSSYVMRYAGSILCVMLTEKLALQTRCRLMSHLCRIPWSEYERQRTGQLQAVIRGDVQQGADMIYSIFSRIELNVLLFVSTFVYMLMISPVPALIIAGFTLLMAFVNQQILTRQKLYRKRSRDAAGEVAETVLTSCRGMSTVRAYRAESFILTLLREKKKAYNNAVYRAELIDAGRLSAYNLTSSFLLYATILMMGYKGIRGEVSWGDILVFIVLVRQVIMPAEVVFRWMGQVADGIAAWERVGDLLEIVLPVERAELPEPEESIALEEVCFSYRHEACGHEAEILRDLNLELKKGDLGILTGESGSGKTTLCKILCGLYEDTTREQEGYGLHMKWILDGKVREGGVPWCVYNPAQPELFHMSIYENIVFGRKEITREECMALARELGAADFIRKLPEGIDTIIEAGGRTLSGGQRQAIVNMRALLSGRKMLILDEAFASLDVERRKRLTDALERRRADHFLLIVTHERDLESRYERAAGLDMRKINKAVSGER